MASSALKVKFIFSNYGGKFNVLDVAPTLTIGEVKSTILKKFIIENYAPADKVGKIRLINLGTEMKDEQTLNDTKKTGTEEEDYNIVMHVHVNPEQQKPQSKPKATEDNQDSTCSCSIF